MKRALAVLIISSASLLAPIAIAAPARAQCAPPDGRNVVWSITDKHFLYYPTNVHSDWTSFRAGGSINYSENKTMQVSASVTATVSAEAGVIFAKASTSVGVTVGGSYSKSKTWSYTANVPADTRHKYRLHAYHYSLKFTVAKYQWVGGSTCDYRRLAHWPQTVNHAPVHALNNVWKLDKRAA